MPSRGRFSTRPAGARWPALEEIPFGQYYGSVDATPLFVLLAGAYHERAADRAFAESIWPHVERALHWIDTDGDRDRDGFVEYNRMSPNGLAQQGWKDSQDSVFHAEGNWRGPIALCEVQGYVYAAKRGAARLAVRSDESIWPINWHGKRKRYASASRKRSGARTWEPMPSRSMAKRSLAVCGRRILAIASSVGSQRRTVPSAWPGRYSIRPPSRVGASGRWPAAKAL